MYEEKPGIKGSVYSQKQKLELKWTSILFVFHVVLVDGQKTKVPCTGDTCVCRTRKKTPEIRVEKEN